MDNPHSTAWSDGLGQRLIELWELTGDEALQRLGEGRPVRDDVVVEDEQARIDWISTSLMRCYRDTKDAKVFALLFELNRGPFLHAIEAKLRRTNRSIESADVLQEVFLNIYRYPDRFVAEKADSFRNWGHRIVQNTLLKFLKGANRLARFASLDEETTTTREDVRVRNPLLSAADSESAQIVDRAYVLYLNLYLLQFRKLSAKEQRALTLVEIDGASYKEAAADLGIRLENLKMVIFRGRRKIVRGLTRNLDQIGTRLERLEEAAATRRAALHAAARRSDGGGPEVVADAVDSPAVRRTLRRVPGKAEASAG